MYYSFGDLQCGYLKISHLSCIAISNKLILVSSGKRLSRSLRPLCLLLDTEPWPHGLKVFLPWHTFHGSRIVNVCVKGIVNVCVKERIKVTKRNTSKHATESYFKEITAFSHTQATPHNYSSSNIQLRITVHVHNYTI